MSVAQMTNAPEDKVAAAKTDLAGMIAIFKYGAGVYARLFLSIGVVTLSAICVMVSARLLGTVVQLLTSSEAIDRTEVFSVGAAFLALEIASVGLQYFGRLGLASSTIQIAYRVRQELFKKMQRLPISYYDFQPLGRTLTRLTNDVEGVENFFSGTLARLVISIINIIAVIIAMLLTDLSFGMVIVASAIPALVFSFALRKPVRHWLRTYRKRSAGLNAKLAEYLNGVAVIRIFGLERWTHESFQSSAGDLLKAGLSMMHWNSFIRPMCLLLCTIPTVVIIWYGGEKVLAGTMQLGLLVAFVRFSERFANPIRTISQEIQHIQEALVSSERVRQMLLEPEEKDELGEDGNHHAQISGDVSFEDVSMYYKKGNPVLQGVNFEVRKGMTVGLVGATGSGKTTTVNLIPRLYNYQEGMITLDGVDLRQWRRSSIRQQMGYVSQDVIMIRGSLRENLTAALPENVNVTDEAILAACEKTGLNQIVSKLANGLDYQILDGGENLSMGERQLIAFTRMLIKNPSIMILDEATANIDEECEALIQGAIANVMIGRTCFVIAHRLSTIVQCDLILVFKNGQIVEQGNHEHLMSIGGHYADLANKQLALGALGM